MEKIYNQNVISKMEYLENAKKYTDVISQFTYKELGITKGATVLEFGCGSGYDVVKMAQLVGRNGKVYGVDIDEETIAYNKDHHQAKNVAFSQSKYPLDFPTAFFDAVRVERVFQHIPPNEISPTIEELMRVMKENGKLCVIETDWKSLQFFSTGAFVETESQIVNFIVQKASSNGLIAREMGRLLLDKKLTLSKNIIYPYTLYTYEEANAFIMLADIIDRAVAQDIVSGEMAHKWHKELILNSKQGLFAMQVNFIITITNK